MKAPFTEEQINSLNGFQKEAKWHPFTCGTDKCGADLIAVKEGWICPRCDYTQDWAHDSMADDSWRKHADAINQWRSKIDPSRRKD